MARMVQCIKLNKEAEGLDFAPLPGDLGKKIWNQVSKEAWADWLKTKPCSLMRTASIWPTPEHANTFSSKSRNISLKVAPIWQVAMCHHRSNCV